MPKTPDPFDPERYSLEGVWNDAKNSVLHRLECVDCSRYFTWSANTEGLATIPDAVMFAARDHRELHSLRKHIASLLADRDTHARDIIRLKARR